MLEKLGKITAQTIKQSLNIPKEIPNKDQILIKLWQSSRLSKQEILKAIGKTEDQWEEAIRINSTPSLFTCIRILLASYDTITFSFGKPKEEALFCIHIDSLDTNIIEDITKIINTYKSALGNKYATTIKKCGTPTQICISNNTMIQKSFDTHKNDINKIHKHLYALGVAVEIENKRTNKQQAQDNINKTKTETEPTKNEHIEKEPITENEQYPFSEYQASLILRMTPQKLGMILKRNTSKLFHIVQIHNEDFKQNEDKSYRISRKGILRIAKEYEAARSTTQRKIKETLENPPYTIPEAAKILGIPSLKLISFINDAIYKINQNEKIILTNIYDKTTKHILKSDIEKLKALFLENTQSNIQKEQPKNIIPQTKSEEGFKENMPTRKKEQFFLTKRESEDIMDFINLYRETYGDEGRPKDEPLFQKEKTSLEEAYETILAYSPNINKADTEINIGNHYTEISRRYYKLQYGENFTYKNKKFAFEQDKETNTTYLELKDTTQRENITMFINNILMGTEPLEIIKEKFKPTDGEKYKTYDMFRKEFIILTKGEDPMIDLFQEEKGLVFRPEDELTKEDIINIIKNKQNN